MANFGHFATFLIFSYQSGIYLEWPILAVMQFFQYFLTKVLQIDSKWQILAILQLFQYFLTKVLQIDSEWPILLFCNCSNIFLLKWSKFIWNGQY